MKPWYSLRGEERAKAKAAYEATVTPLVQRGPRPDEILTLADAIIVRGVRYDFANHGGAILARMLAHACCPPLEPGYEIEVTKRFIRVGPVTFYKNVAAAFTRLTYENLKRALASQQDAVEGGPSTAP